MTNAASLCKRLLAIGAATVVAMEICAAVRSPAAYGDSEAQPIDTRVGAVLALTDQSLDSRVSSWDVSGFGDLDTFNSPGLNIIIR